MRLSSGRALLPLLLGALFYALSFARHVDVLRQSQNVARKHNILAARAGPTCRSVCGANPQNSVRRQIPEIPNNLVARVLDPISNDQLTTYLINTINDLGTTKIYDPDESQTNTAGFTRLARRVVRVGLRRLCGCTAMVIVHPKGVYYAHFFEDQSHGIEDGVDLFQVKVLDLLGNGEKPFFLSLGSARNPLNSAETRVYIMTPLSDDPDLAARGIFQYAEDIPRLLQGIRDILPNVLDPTVRGYAALDHEIKEQNDELDNSFRGRILFEYDPTGAVPQSRLFFEDQVMFEQL
ncbi:hypothetical protein FGG08_006638 [Glutinoglossum americanum]|uniref:Uncharacterized protein n=1 Tax=Glutinoglossum americanum TaxID=1670608 RepID=A0A9P8L1P8_9PEZI|nr:hypothetical protein FGG08_006638 [Glutinoglossum americanum]